MPDIEKRRKVIQVLTCAANHADEGMISLSADEVREIVALLKAQMPRVMTLEEVTHSEDWLWYERRNVYQGWVKMNDCDGEWIDWEDCTIDRLVFYGSQWRCWTSRPTPEQMASTPWEVDAE